MREKPRGRGLPGCRPESRRGWVPGQTTRGLKPDVRAQEKRKARL